MIELGVAVATVVVIVPLEIAVESWDFVRPEGGGGVTSPAMKVVERAELVGIRLGCGSVSFRNSCS